jgi:hypothetical protein
MTKLTRHLTISYGAALTALLATGAARADALDCGSMDAEALGVPEVSIASSVAVSAGADAPVSHCLVSGATQERTGIDDGHYAIAFELRLPEEWNGRLVHQFNGGNDGNVVPAFGPLAMRRIRR